jgi:uncharacterized membrane protein YqhA
MFERILTSSRYLTIVAVIGSLISSIALLLYGGLEVFYLVSGAITRLSIDGTIEKTFILTFVEVIELFLLGCAFYIIALGLYELFINDSVKLPMWLEIHDFDDLKGKLVSVLVVILGVIFLGAVATWDKKSDLLGFGAAIALVIAALTYFLGHKGKKGGAPSGAADSEK